MRGAANLLQAALAVMFMLTATKAASAQATGEAPAARPRTVWDGVYSDAQAARGEASYSEHCASCHRDDLAGYSGLLRGARFMEKFREASVHLLFDKTKTTMPRNAAGTLSDQTYLDIVSYVLKANEFPAGHDELQIDDLTRVMVVRKGGAEPVPDFSLVQVVGCFGRRDDSLDADKRQRACTDRTPAAVGRRARRGRCDSLGLGNISAARFALIRSCRPRRPCRRGSRISHKASRRQSTEPDFAPARRPHLQPVNTDRRHIRTLWCAGVLALTAFLFDSLAAQQMRRHLYVAVPGAETDLPEPAALGILVFDIDNGHEFVRRISPWPARKGRDGEHARGIAVHTASRRLYLSAIGRLAAIDLVTDRVVWEHNYDGHCCDRLDVSPDGGTIYAPAFGKPTWYVIDARDGSLKATIAVMGWPRHAIYSRDGRHVYLSAWESNVLTVADTKTNKAIREVGPFGDSVCPFAIDGKEAFVFATVDGLVGFEVADLRSGLLLDRVISESSDPAAWPRYECPSHGIALTPDQRELWVADGAENRLHVFDATTYPPVAARAIQLPAQPRWITFSIDGRYAYPSTGDVVDVPAGKITGALEDERGQLVRSERLVEIDFTGGVPVRAGRQ